MVETKGFARLRAGPVAALTCHRHVIHSRSPSNPFDTKRKAHPDGWTFFLVETKGFEPSTSRMRTERSPASFTNSRNNRKDVQALKPLETQTKPKFCVYVLYIDRGEGSVTRQIIRRFFHKIPSMRTTRQPPQLRRTNSMRTAWTPSLATPIKKHSK